MFWLCVLDVTMGGMHVCAGYDVKSATTRDGELYITGAPRFNHTGRVIIYRLNGSDVVISQILKGEQVSGHPSLHPSFLVLWSLVL